LAEINLEDPAVGQAMQIYDRMGQHIYLRRLKEYYDLLKPWQPEGKGFVPLLEWHGFEQSELGKEDTAVYGPMGGGYGAYLVK
jgi:hypothetical protein